MRQISLDNGCTFLTAKEAVKSDGYNFETILNLMDNDTREKVHSELAPCGEDEFLARYLELATDDLIIG